jgi:polyprenyl-phospho-N-acetylgalactosaminyl synthase
VRIFPSIGRYILRMVEVRKRCAERTGGGRSATFVLVPAYNEAAVLEVTLAPLIDAGYTVVVVDDGSTDRTWSTLEALPVVRLRHAANLGQGAALATAIRFAAAHHATAAVTFDADGQHDAAQIPALLAPVLDGRADVVLGSRFLDPRDTRAIPPFRRLALRAATVVNGLFTGLWLTDAHNGFRALSRRALQTIHLRECGYAHATELLEQVRAGRLSWIEVPVRVRYTSYSMAKGQRTLNGLGILLDLALRKVFS